MGDLVPPRETEMPVNRPMDLTSSFAELMGRRPVLELRDAWRHRYRDGEAPLTIRQKHIIVSLVHSTREGRWLPRPMFSKERSTYWC